MSENILIEGMRFRYLKDVSKILGVEYDKSVGKKFRKELNKYCDYIKTSEYGDKYLITRVKCTTSKNECPVKYKYEIGQRIVNNKGDFTITDRYFVTENKIKAQTGRPFVGHKKYYICKCNKCGYDKIDKVEQVIDKTGCPACCTPPSVIVKGINDIATTNPWMVKYFKNKDDAYKYSKTTKTRVMFKCPECGREIEKAIGTVYAIHGIACPCGDSMSYPNKFMFSLLSQLQVDFDIERIYEWSQNKKYDDVINYNGKTIIIENHGIQHYEDTRNVKFAKYEKQHEIDLLKEKLALQNGIDHYLQIDCRVSDMDYIKNSIMNSELPKLLNFSISDIDWVQCDFYATKNIKYDICKEYDPVDRDTQYLMKKYRMSNNAICRFLHEGTKRGWCNYTPYEKNEMLTLKRMRIATDSKPILCIEDECVYHSSTLFVYEYEQKYGKKLQARNIRSVCLGKRNRVNNLHFKYITREEFNRIKTESPDKAYGDFFNTQKSA